MIKYKLKKQYDSVYETVIKNRGLNIDDIEELLNPNINNLESPFKFTNMKKGIYALKNAISKGVVIAVVVDSDCWDGYCSAAMIYHFIKDKLNYNNIYYILQERAKAHGFNEFITNTIIENNVELVIMPDAGSNDIKEHKLLKESNIDLIIIDHHELDTEVSSDTILINCKSDSNVKNKDLSGAAVVYKFIEAYSDEFDSTINPDYYLDLVSLSLISDMVDMNNLENRLLHSFGKQYQNINNALLKEYKEKDREYFSIENSGFNIAPDLNAVVRYGTMEEKELVFTSLIDPGVMIKSKKRGEEGKIVPISKEAKRIATNIKVRQNKDRDKAVKKIFDLIDSSMKNEKVLIINTEDVSNSSLNGLIANKIVEKYNRPVIMTSDKEKKGIFSGSIRGINNCPELPSFKEFCLDSELFIFVQGHANAAGYNITKDNLEKFKEYANNKLKYIELSSLYEVDAHYQNGVILQDVIDIAELDDLWCNSIPAPLFAIKGIRVHTSDIKKIGNATYTFRLDGITYTKNFGSKVFYENLIKKDSLPLGGNIEIDIIAKFRKNIKGYAYVDIVNAESKIL